MTTMSPAQLAVIAAHMRVGKTIRRACPSRGRRPELLTPEQQALVDEKAKFVAEQRRERRNAKRVK